ncbi:MAG: substrate-binding domain-containing protein [Lachnospiraceae bacterium]|nr:substrate-binding domain-containing protein [Lachnospiraceae bacterium]
MKRILYSFVLCILLSGMIGCSALDQDKNKKEEVSSEVPDFIPLTTIKEGQPDIYVIIKLMDSSYWKVIINGVHDAGEALSCNVYYSGTNNETDWKGQQKLINTALENNAKGIILAPDDSIELSPDIEHIHELGIPIVLVDTIANTDAFDICYMTDNLLAGQKAAEEMINQLYNIGHKESDSISVGIMVGQSTSQTINERLAGFYRYWSANAPKTWTIISDIKNCNGNIDLGGTLTEDLINNYPNLCGLYGTNNGPTRALCSTVLSKGRTDIVVIGFDFSDEMKNLIESDEYTASTMLQRQYNMGYRAVQSVNALFSNRIPKIKFEDTGVVTVNKTTLYDTEVQEVLEQN